MKTQEKVWALLVNLGIWQGGEDESSGTFKFDQSAWERLIDIAADAGINTFILDCGGAIELASHPEIKTAGAWTRKKLRDEIEKCRAKNIRILPKLNFSTIHDHWLGKYHLMISTPEYYKVCNDVIKEVYELFEHPKYIHLGMDEEDEKHARVSPYDSLAVYRKDDLYFHDLRFLIDCVADTGAKPWMWGSALHSRDTEVFLKHINPDEVVFLPGSYSAIYEEHWTPISTRQVFLDYYNQPDYKGLGIEYVEQDPWLVNFREKALPLANKYGFNYIPDVSNANKCDISFDDSFRYFKEGMPDEQILGFCVSPWKFITEENLPTHEHALKLFKAAKEKYYG